MPDAWPKQRPVPVVHASGEKPVDHDSTRHYPPPESCRVLAEARRAAGWSTRRLAAAAGTNFSYVAKLERGERSPSLTMARALIRALGLTGERAALIEAGAVRGTGWDRRGGPRWT